MVNVSAGGQVILHAHNAHLTKPQLKRLKEETFKGWELVQATARLCAMNMLLHGIGSQDFEPIVVADSLAADPGDRFDLVLTDEIMPGTTGTELAIALHEIRPDIPVILMTGYAGEICADRQQAAGIREILRKPISLDSMSRCLARHLTRR